jgi:primosomal protein N' (replication factor Y)
VAVNIPQLAGLFDYSIPAEWIGEVNVGSLVTVPFGRQTTQGIVVSLPVEPAVPNPKALASIVDKEPVVNENQIRLAQWMAQENLTGLSACLDLMLPPGLAQQADITLHLLEPKPSVEITPLQTRIVNLLMKRGDLRGKQMDRALPHADWRKSLHGLVKHGVLRSSPVLLVPTTRAKVGRTVEFLSMPERVGDEKRLGKPGSASLQRRLNALNFLQEESGAVGVSFVYAETGATAPDLALLAELGFIRFSEAEITRDPLARLNPIPTEALQLTPEQQLVVTHVKQQLNGANEVKPNLLQGVTSSGKTEVYLQAVDETLRLGKQAIILVPEISLTPQTVSRFLARFQGKVALIHSRLSPGERYDTWRRIRSGELPVVVGARSALFAPLKNLGLIVIDECHDGSYHQEDLDPRYHAVSTALAYAGMTGSVLIMGSATPEVEQLYLFRSQKWNIFQLPNRVMAHLDVHPLDSDDTNQTLPLPEVEVVDMRAELVAGNRSSLSRSLQRSIAQVLADQTQAILFLNRRGSSSYVFCRDCGYVLKCSRCDTPLTFHENQSMLVCHHCNNQRQMPVKCPQCNSPRIKQFGLGTESLQKLVAEAFPQARLLRWDADTSKAKGAHDLIMEHFMQHRADILIGTQMLAKGLDLPNVTLVGVILADVSLNMPDFRAPERTFQLLTQVAGRAGRSSLGGHVILQTFHPEHYAIQSAAAYDFDGFEKQELEYRRQTGYPPFSRLVKIELRHYKPELVEQAAKDVGDHFTAWLMQDERKETDLIGPTPCFFQRHAGYYRWQILLRGPNPQEFLRNHPQSTWQPAGVIIEITVDPSNLL